MIPIEYKRHQDSIEDRSSYRNPNMVWRAPSKSEKDGLPSNRGGYHSNYKTEGKFHSTNHDQQNSYSKPAWKNRWTEGAEGPGRPNKEKEDANGWRKVGGGSSKPESFGSSRPAKEVSTTENDVIKGEKSEKNHEGWTKVKNPFAKSDS